MSYSHTLPGEANTESFARFYLGKTQNNHKSKLEGHAVFDDVEMVEIVIPGDKNTLVDTMVNDSHRQRWPQLYKAFKEGLSPSETGYPIEHWPAITAAQAANFKALHIHTVEALAGLSDGVLQNVGLGARDLRTRAQNWLQRASDAKPMDRLQAELDDEKAKNAVMQNQIEELMASVRKLQEKPVAQ